MRYCLIAAPGQTLVSRLRACASESWDARWHNICWRTICWLAKGRLFVLVSWQQDCIKTPLFCNRSSISSAGQKRSLSLLGRVLDDTLGSHPEVPNRFRVSTHEVKCAYIILLVHIHMKYEWNLKFNNHIESSTMSHKWREAQGMHHVQQDWWSGYSYTLQQPASLPGCCWFSFQILCKGKNSEPEMTLRS